ncbi:TonB-dependent receptor [Limibacter armeniacum]|uniref:SusC/RagA family TonB-linked outer membrane protein n=1 Tax=Limibacter armeniacum TaxID=466084 RepID=UPI002FE61CAC
MKKRIYFILYLFLVLCGVNNLYGQQADHIISGKVSDENGYPVPGVTVMVLGTTKGSATDINGEFKLSISNSDEVLTVSYIGYKTQQIQIGTATHFDISLEVDTEQLEEVVVIGYGTVQKDDATGALEVIDSKQFNKGAINSPAQLITGKVAGVAVTSNSGAPGNSSTIRIRGGASLSASNDPLIVIDNVPLDNTAVGGAPNILSTLNPNDIETFTVLKDASATAIYGSRASNGVILITTKRGAKGFKVDYSFTGSVYTTPNRLDVYSGDEYRALVQERYPESPEVTGLLGDANTDWQDEIYQVAFGQDHNITVSGGKNKTNYRASLGYNNTDGVLKTYNFERMTLSVGLDQKLFNDRLVLQVNAKGMLNNNNFADQGAIGNAVSYDPTQPVVNGNTRWRGYTTWTKGGIDGEAINLATANPVAQLALTNNTSEVKRMISNFKADYKILENLNASINVGHDYTLSEGQNNVLDSTQWISTPVVNGGRYNPYKVERENKLLDFYLNYNKEFNNLKLDAMLGYSWAHFYRGSSSQVLDYKQEVENQPVVNASENYLVSFFGRVNANLYDRYLLTFSLRKDGTSRFSEDNKWGTFPAAAFAWHIANEQFLTNSDVVSDLKLRLGYGETGQQDIGNDYPHLATYTRSDNASRYPFGPNYINTLRPNGYDANIKWESSTTYNAGVDFGLFENRLTGSVDVYYKETYNLLGQVDPPAGTNFTSKLLTNVSSMNNKGVEVNLNWIAITNEDWNWKLNANMTYNKNEITKLNLTDDDDYSVYVGNIGSTTDGTIQVHKVGYPAYSFLAYQQVYNADGSPVQGAYVDRNNDGIINDNDKYVFQKPVPDVTLGFNTWLTYKNFELSVNTRASLNNYVYNNIQALNNLTSLYDSKEFLRNMPKTDFELNSRFSDHFIEDASFFRIDNINLAYNLGEVFQGLAKLQVSGGINNVLVITNYSGLDPEISGGLDNSFYPRTRSYLLGLRASF